MIPRARIRRVIRKVVKWVATVLTVLLLLAWMSSGWWGFTYNRVDHKADYAFAMGAGSVVCRFRERFSPSTLSNWQWVNASKLDWRSWRRSLNMWRYHDTTTTFGRERYVGASVVFPMWAPLVATIPMGALAWVFDIRALRRERVGLCSKCGYDLAAISPQTPCPECGTTKAIVPKA
jgi:hypothetical protein